MKYAIRAWLFLLVIPVLLPGQQAKVDRITIEDGLSQGMIFKILQDQQGFLWIATKDGLNRFDGYDFVYYSHDPSDTTSLSGHIVNTIFEDSRGWLWVGTDNNGLNLFDRKTGKFYRLISQRDQQNTLQSNNILTITEDLQGNLIVGSSIGIDRITIPREVSKKHPDYPKIINNFIIQPIPISFHGKPYETKVNSFLPRADGSLLIATENGIFIKPPASDVAIPWLDGSFTCESNQRFCGVHNIIEDNKGNILFGQNSYIKKIEEGILKKFPLPSSLKSYAIRLAKGVDGKIYGASSGLFRLRENTSPENAIDIIFQQEGLSNIPSIFVDQNGVLWLGTNGYGIIKYNPSAAAFNHLSAKQSLRQIYVDQSNRIWVWIDLKLLILDPQTNQLKEPEGFPDIVVECRWMLQDKKGNYWFHYPIEEEGVRLIYYNPETGISKQYPYHRKAYPLSNLVEDSKGNIWLGCESAEIFKFNPASEQFTYYNFSKIIGPDQAGAIATVLYADSSDVMWIGTQFGLLRLNEKESPGNQFQLFQHETDNPLSLSENYILSILENPQNDGQMWIGTMGGGLNLFQEEQGTFTSITTQDGLPNNIIYGILPDEKGNLWLSTNRGLSKFNPQRKTFDNFTSFDGLQSNEFNTGSYTKAPDGRLIFGGVNGFNIFHPSDLETPENPPKIVFTELMINSAPVDFQKSPILKTPIEMTRELCLKYDQNLLHFKFAALDLTVSNRNQYRYQMVGVDPNWVEARYNREVTYANLAPGNYTFKVWGANRSLHWSETPAEIHIKILPPWWRTPVAYISYAILLLSLSLGIYRFQLNRIRLKNQLDLEHQEAERLAELNHMKSNFFSNITHEFRTPLTLILEPARHLLEQLKSNDHRKYASLIRSNARRMLHLVNQLLDLSKIESGQMPLHWHQGNVIQTARDVFQNFVPLADKQSIKLFWEAPDQDRKFAFDKGKLEQIISNLLSNALKFTPKGGHILFKIDFSPTNQQAAASILHLMVKDSGIGIAADQQEKVFERFYQIEQDPANKSIKETTGTGIGLSLVKELVNLMQGSIRLQSQPDIGTTFYIDLPLRESGKISNSEAPLVLSMTDQEELTTSSSKSENPLLNSLDTPIVLIVEDNPDLRDFIQSMLKDKFKILTAADGAEGLRQATNMIPDLIISDVMMPIMDGYTLCDHLKNQEQTAHIPIILLTAKSSFEHKLKGLKTGADAYLTKPFNTEELTTRIENLIAIRKKLQEKFSSQKGNPQKDISFPNVLDNEFLRKLTEAIDQHIDDESLSIEILASKVQMSRSQLHRKLKALINQSATEFLRNYRLDKAMELLQHQRGNVTEVAMMVGFSSQPYFSTRFKERFGFSPKEASISPTS
mgnify:CR=1 FL=1